MSFLAQFITILPVVCRRPHLNQKVLVFKFKLSLNMLLSIISWRFIVFFCVCLPLYLMQQLALQWIKWKFYIFLPKWKIVHKAIKNPRKKDSSNCTSPEFTDNLSFYTGFLNRGGGGRQITRTKKKMFGGTPKC